jgi:hypothetical protein
MILSLLWWLPALVIALVAGIMPDAFLDAPGATIPHEAAYLLRDWMVGLAFVYLAVMLIVRVCTHFGWPESCDDHPAQSSSVRKGFPVIEVPTERGPFTES